MLDDGIVIELIEGRNGAEQPQLLVWDGKQAQVAQHFTHGDTRYLPIGLEPTLARAMRFPKGVQEYGSTRKLFEKVFALFAQATRLPESVVASLVFFTFSTWFADFLPVAPFLWVIAPPTVSREPLWQLLAMLCRRVLVVNEFGAPALRSLPMELRPTLMNEASAISRSFLKALFASQRRGSYEAAGGKVRDLFCAKIIWARQPLSDSTVSGLPLEIALSPTQEPLPRMDMAEVEGLTAEVQGKLLLYRLRTYRQLASPSVDLGDFTAPVQELAQNLAMSVVGDPKLRLEIVPLLKQLDREVRIDRTLLLECIVLEGLWAACHSDSSAETLSVTELTRSVNTILRGRGELREVSPETVGWKLRALGFHTEPIAGGNKGLALTEVTRVKIHTLAAAYGVRTLQQGPPKQRCPQCPNVLDVRDRR